MALKPAQGGGMAEGQDRLAGVGCAGLFKQLGGVRMAVLVHPHRPRQMQQPGIIGKSLQQGSQNPVGGIRVPGLKQLAGLGKGMINGGSASENDHKSQPIAEK